MSKEFEIFQRLLKASTANLAQSFYDSFVEKNANLRSKAGVKTSIIRRQIGKCCKWCSDLAGTYENGTQPKDIYKRHENCRCLVTFKSKKGTYTDIWNKKEFKTQKDARLTREKEIQEVYRRKNIKNPAESEKIILKSKKVNDTIAAGGIFVNMHDKLAEYAKLVKPIDGYTDIVCHANFENFFIYTNDDEEITFSPEEFGRLILNSKEFKNGAIRIISCKAGAKENGAAQKLANAINQNVLAPTETVTVNSDGEMFVSDNKVLVELWSSAKEEDKPKILQTGTWKVFKPKK